MHRLAESISAKPEARTPRRAARYQRAERRAARALGNTRISFPTSADRRAERWALRDVLRGITRISSVRKCGHTPIAGAVSLRAGEGGSPAAYAGLHTCGSVWICPVCAAKIAARRKEEVEQVLRKAVQAGLHVSMLTLTQRHHNGQSLEELWNALTAAWTSVVGGRKWLEFKENLGVIGYMKATEVTHGDNGWHTHLHILFITEKDPATTVLTHQRKQGRACTPYPVEVYTPADFIAERWAKALAKRGIDFLRGPGLDWSTARDARAIGAYVAKIHTPASMSAETTLGGFKTARQGNRTPFQILADIAQEETPRDLALWAEYEKVSRGRRALIFSNGLRAWAGLLPEKSDEEIAAEVPERGQTVAIFTNEEWRIMRHKTPAALLTLLEILGPEAVYEWLEDRGIPFHYPTPPPEAQT